MELEFETLFEILKEESIELLLLIWKDGMFSFNSYFIECVSGFW